MASDVTRELDESQMPDGDLSDTDEELQAYKQAERIEEAFESIVEDTIDDDTGYATVKEIYTAPSNNSMVVKVALPGQDDTKEFRLPKPKLASEKNSFVRWLRMYDYSVDNFSGMVENRVKVQVEETNGSYSLVYPEYDDRTRWDKVSTSLSDGYATFSKRDDIQILAGVVGFGTLTQGVMNAIAFQGSAIGFTALSVVLQMAVIVVGTMTLVALFGGS